MIVIKGTGSGEKDVSAVIEEVLLNPLTDGVTLSGGEPFLQAADCSLIAKAAHENGLNVWTYSGYTFEELLKMGEKDDAVSSLLHETDILIDGRFELPLRSLALNWRGSKNQRVIDVKKSFEAG